MSWAWAQCSARRVVARVAGESGAATQDSRAPLGWDRRASGVAKATARQRLRSAAGAMLVEHGKAGNEPARPGISCPMG